MGQEHAGRALQEVQVSRSAFLQVDNLSLKKKFPEYYLTCLSYGGASSKEPACQHGR